MYFEMEIVSAIFSSVYEILDIKSIILIQYNHMMHN